MRRFLFMVVLSHACQWGLAQSNYRFLHFDTHDGLASEASSFILQDSLGFIWTFYNGGLSSGALTRFDGYNFKVYNFDPNDSIGSPGGWIDRIQVDQNGTLWVINASMTGDNSYLLMRYDKETDSFIKIRPPVNGVQIISVSFEKDKPIIWLSGWDGAGLFRFNYRTNEIKNYRNPHPDLQTQKMRNSLITTQSFDRFLFTTTQQGIWRFDKTTEKFSRPRCDPKDSSLFFHPSTFHFIVSGPNSSDHNKLWVAFLGQEVVRIDSNFSITSRLRFPPELNLQSLGRDKDDVMWIAGHNGLYRYDPKDNSLVNIKQEAGDSYSLATNYLDDLWIDRDDNIWLATDKGISMLKKQSLTFYNQKIKKTNPVGTFKAGERDFLMVTKFDPLTGTNEIYTAPIFSGRLDSLRLQRVPLPVQIQGGVYDFVKGERDFWIGSYGSGITRLPISSTSGMIEPKLATQLRHSPNNVNSLSSDRALGMFEEHGNLWVSVQELGINKIALAIPFGQEGSVTRYTHIPEDSNSIANNMAFRFFPADDKSFWVNTKSAIDLFHDGRFEHVVREKWQVYSIFKASDGITYIGTTDGLYTSKKGYPYKFEKDPVIKSYAALGIHEDKLNRLWLSNQLGVLMYDPKENLSIEFSTEDGIHHTFENMERTSRGFLITTDLQGVTIFDPLSLAVSRAKTYPVLTRLLVNNSLPVLSNRKSGKDDFIITRDITMLKELVLDYKHNNFTLEFTAMEMTAPRKNRYQYKLEGYDPDWIETDWKNRTATYTNLDAGQYTFRVKASNHHGVWSDQQRTLAVVVLPPPWKTAWAYAGYGLLIIGILWAARRNIVQRERLTANLKLAKVEQEKEHFELEKAKEVDRVKTSFFTNISHEFRTPLTLIKGPVEALLDRFKDDPDVIQRLKLVQRNSDLLLKLINQLLDLAKLESGTLKVEKSDGDLLSFVRAVSSSFESLARQKNIDLIVEVKASGQSALFDKDKLETIIINLVNNAIKFTPAGGRVTILAEARDLQRSTDLESGVTPLHRRGAGLPAEAFAKAGGEVKPTLFLSVADTGVGIPYEHQQKIFERFHQVSEAHKEAGTGIGLALVKELVQLLGGSIVVRSEVGKGSEFVVTLPVETTVSSSGSGVQHLEAADSEVLVESSDVNQEHRTRNPEPDSVRPHILVVEDNSDLRSFIIESLGNEFYFLEAENGKLGLDMAIREIPDLIISDVMMPEMDGITMAGKIKKDIRTSHISLILLTAKSTEDSMLTGLQSGADDYLTKPFNRNELLLKVRNGVGRQVKLREKLRMELLSSAPKIEALNEDEKFLNQVKEKILERLSDEQLSVESLAEDIGLSRSQLLRKVTALTGLSVNELIRKLRLQRAEQLIRQNWGPVSQVAYEVGFSSLSYFSKVFKEEFGALPSEYAEKS